MSEKYGTPDRQAMQSLARQLETLTLSPQETIPAYFMRIRILALQLSTAAEPVPDHQLVRYALQGLPPGVYDRIKSTIAHTADVTFEQAETMLLRDATYFPQTRDSMPLFDAIQTVQRCYGAFR